MNYYDINIVWHLRIVLANVRNEETIGKVVVGGDVPFGRKGRQKQKEPLVFNVLGQEGDISEIAPVVEQRLRWLRVFAAPDESLELWFEPLLLKYKDTSE